VTPATDLNEAYISLAEHGYRHFPVCEGDRLVGIISIRDMLRIAYVRPVVHPSLIEAPRGLEGVVVAETAVGDVRGQEGFYHYREYNATELAAKRSLEDVWYLLYYGRLPNKEELGSFREQVKDLRVIPKSVKKLLPDIAKAGEHFIPLDALRS